MEYMEHLTVILLGLILVWVWRGMVVQVGRVFDSEQVAAVVQQRNLKIAAAASLFWMGTVSLLTLVYHDSIHPDFWRFAFWLCIFGQVVVLALFMYGYPRCLLKRALLGLDSTRKQSDPWCFGKWQRIHFVVTFGLLLMGYLVIWIVVFATIWL
jgi:hypothetical protein